MASPIKQQLLIEIENEEDVQRISGALEFNS